MSNQCEQSCGLFDFMANEVGINVLHPGGYKATAQLLSCCRLSPKSHVLDVACGSGSSAIYLSKKYGCSVTGIDISEALIEKAKQSHPKQKRIHFETGDATALPFADNTFDAVVSQAFFVMIDQQEQALKEMLRVLKPGGYLGMLEKSWFKPPSVDVYNDLVTNTCTSFIPRVQTFEEWEAFVCRHSASHVKTWRHPMSSGMFHLLQSEGLVGFARIMKKMMGNGPMRKRMMTVQRAFEKHTDFLGYGIYCFQKN